VNFFQKVVQLCNRLVVPQILVVAAVDTLADNLAAVLVADKLPVDN
jgi:hypothetical protein